MIKRKALTLGRKVHAFANHALCPGCKEPYPEGDVEFHHEPPLELKEDEDECQLIPLCKDCHKARTDYWRKHIDKARSLRGGRGSQKLRREKRKQRGQNTWPKGRRLQSRGFETRKEK